MPRACESHYGSRRRRESTTRAEQPEVKRAPKASGSEAKSPKVGQRPYDSGPPLTAMEIQLAPVIWAKLSGYSWWPARAASPEEVKGVKKPHGKDMICTYFLGDNNIGFVKLSNVLRFTHENCEQYGSRITTKSFKDGVTAAMALLRENDKWEKECQVKAEKPEEAVNGNPIDVTGPDPGAPIDVDGTGTLRDPVSDDGACEMCGDNNEAKGDILLCDSCDAEYHLACCTPPLKACPEGEWFCLTCRVSRGEPVSVLFNEERAKKEATAQQHQWLGKPPLPNKAGTKRSATDAPSPKKAQHKKVKPNGSSSSSTSASAGGAVSDGNANTSSGNTAGNTGGSVGVSGSGGGVISAGTGLVNSGASVFIAEKPGTASPVVANRAPAVAPPAPAVPASTGTNSRTDGNANSIHMPTVASPASVASTPPPRGVSNSSPGTCTAPSSSATEQQQRTLAEDGTTGSGSNGSGGSAVSNNAPRRGRPPGSTAVNSNRLSSRGGRPGRPPSKHHLRQGRPPNKPTTVVANSTNTATTTASVYARSNGNGGSKDNGGGKMGGRGGGTNSTSGGRSNENHSYQQQQQQHVLVRGKRPRGDADGGVTGAGGRGWGGSAGSSSSGNARHGRTPPPVPASYVNASHAFARLGIPVSLPGGGRAAVQQQLHLQQTVQQLQATRHLHYQRAAFGGVLGTTAAAAAAVAAMQGGRRSPSAVAEPAEMPQCFICQEDVTQWGENAGNGEALRCAYEGCGRVFHVTCVAHILQDVAVHTPDGSGAVPGKWTCPLHRCARCGTDGSSGGENAAPAIRRKSSGNPGEGSAGGSRLWQCTWCSVAFCMKHLPSQLSTAGRKARVADANQCLHCRSPSPRVKLALLLEGMCSRLANHHLAIPFLRPFLPGIASAKRSSPSGVADADREAVGGVKREGVGGCSPSGANFSAAAPAADQGVDGTERGMLGVDPAGRLPTGGISSTAGSTGSGASASRHEGGGNEVVRNGSSKASWGSSSPSPLVSSPGGVRGAGMRGRRGKSAAPCAASVEAPAWATAKTNTRNSPTSLGAVTVPYDVEDIMGLLDKTRALGYSRSMDLMADMRMLQGKCKQAVAKWGGDPETGGGFGGGAGRVVVKAMDTLAAIMESMLARSREELTNVETDIAKKSEHEHRRLTERGVGDGTAGDAFPWRAECLPPPLRPSAATANGSSYSSGAGEHRSRLPPLRLTRRWSLAKWAEYLQNPPMLRRSTGQTEPGETITVSGKEVLGTVQMRRDIAEGMCSPAFPADPDDSEMSDGCYMSDFYSDDDLDEADPGRDGGGGDELGPVVPPWSELETAVQALMGMEGGERREDTWDVTESARLVQIESVLEEQRRLMRRMIKHNGNLRALWRRYAASPLEDRGGRGSEGVVTLGETSVLKEFKISNDLLRKRVEDLEDQLRIQAERTEGAFPTERPGHAPVGRDNGRPAGPAAGSAVNVAAPARTTAAPARLPVRSVTSPGVAVNHSRENGLIATKSAQMTATAKFSSPVPTSAPAPAPTPASSAQVHAAPSAVSDAGPGLALCSASASADSTSADEREEGPLVDVVGCSPEFPTEPTAMNSVAAPPVTSSYVSTMRSGSAASQSMRAGVSVAGLRAAGSGAGSQRIEAMAVARERFSSTTHSASATRGLPISVACASNMGLPEKRTADSGDSLENRVEIEGLGPIGVSDAIRTGDGVIQPNDVGDDDGDGVDPIDDDGEAVTVEGSGGMDVEENGTADNDDDDAGVLL